MKKEDQKIWDKIDKGVFVIAEIGKNFIQSKDKKDIGEYLKNSKKLIKLAKESGADAVKFQTHNYEDEQLPIKVVSPHFSGMDRYSWVRFNSQITPLKFWEEIKRYCDKLGILFFSTPMSRGAAIKLNKIDVPLWKVGSGDILDFVMLDYISKTNKPIIISSGMSTLKEVDKAVNFIKKNNSKLALMHCVSKYPCPEEELNLKTINFFKKRYNIPVGFSDHSIGYKYVLGAIKIGATIVEKHFSLSRDLWGSDHKASMTPEEFKNMTLAIKKGEKVNLLSYGIEKKILQKDELVFRPFFRKSLVAGQDIKRGAIISSKMIYAMRPQGYINDIASDDYEKVINKKINKNIKKYTPLNWNILE